MNNSKHSTSNDSEIDRIAKLIDCPAEIVRHCMMQIGPSVPAIDAYWQMNKDRLLLQCAQRSNGGEETSKNEARLFGFLF